MLFFRPKPRSFTYIPRYYKEGNDPERRIRFRRKTLYDPHQRRPSFITLLLLFLLILLLIGYLIPKLGTVNPRETRISPDNVVTLPDTEHQR